MLNPYPSTATRWSCLTPTSISSSNCDQQKFCIHTFNLGIIAWLLKPTNQIDADSGVIDGMCQTSGCSKFVRATAESQPNLFFDGVVLTTASPLTLPLRSIVIITHEVIFSQHQPHFVVFSNTFRVVAERFGPLSEQFAQVCISKKKKIVKHILDFLSFSISRQWLGESGESLPHRPRQSLWLKLIIRTKVRKSSHCAFN